MWPAFVIPFRDKIHAAPWLKRCIDSAFAQTMPCEIILSDQGSTDGTYELVLSAADSYSGPHTVTVLRCPETRRTGMAGLNAHINWIHREIRGRADIVVWQSCDDFSAPTRIERMAAVFASLNPSYIVCGTEIMTADGSLSGVTQIDGSGSRMVSTQDCVENLVGSNGAPAWSVDLMETCGPMPDLPGQDMVMPIWATFQRGLFFLDERLYTIVLHNDAQNLGLEGRLRAAVPGSDEALRLTELNVIHNLIHWGGIAKLADKFGRPFDQATDIAIARRIVGATFSFYEARTALEARGLKPLPLGEIRDA